MTDEDVAEKYELYRQGQEAMNNMLDPTKGKMRTLAFHCARLDAMDQGLAYWESSC